MKENLYVHADGVIVNLLKEEKKSFVDMSEVFQFCDYIEEQLRKQEYIEKIQSVYFDINFNAIERTVKYNNYIFDLVGDRIFLKQMITPEIETRFDVQPILSDLIKQFVLNKFNAITANLSRSI